MDDTPIIAIICLCLSPFWFGMVTIIAMMLRAKPDPNEENIGIFEESVK